MFSKKSFKNKMKQDFSELLKFFESNSEYTNYSDVSDKTLTFGEDIKFTKDKKLKKTFFIPFFEKSSNISSEDFSAWDFNIYWMYRFIIGNYSLLFVTAPLLFLFFFFIRKRYKFVFSTYTFYFISYVYDFENLFKFFSEIFK